MAVYNNMRVTKKSVGVTNKSRKGPHRIGAKYP